MKVLIVAEGKHEHSGALETLIRRLGGDEATYEKDVACNKRIHASHGKRNRCYKRALRWLLEAEKRDVDALIMLVDEDGQHERVAQMTEAQSTTQSHLRRALGVAIRTFDAWMLADEKTLTSVLGYAVSRLPDPETIRNPKERCAGLLERSPNRISRSRMYARIADGVDLDLLAQRCPSGFGVFSTRVRTVFA